MYSSDPTPLRPEAAAAPALEAAPADHASEEAALGEAAAELDEVEAALARLEDGSFESCELCGASIGRERLEADPLLTRCVQHTPPSAPAPPPAPAPNSQ